MKKTILLIIFTLFFSTAIILAQNEDMPIPPSVDETKESINLDKKNLKDREKFRQKLEERKEQLRQEIKENREKFRQKIKKNREQLKQEIKENKIFINKELRRCYTENILPVAKIIREQKKKLIEDYKKNLESATTTEEKAEIRKEYLNQLRKINNEFNNKAREIRKNCQKDNSTSTNQ